MENTEISPPSGYSLEYDLMTVERWRSENTLYSLTVYKIPPWNGSKAKYVFASGSTLYFKLDNLSTIEYNETEKNGKSLILLEIFNMNMLMMVIV